MTHMALSIDGTGSSARCAGRPRGSETPRRGETRRSSLLRSVSGSAPPPPDAEDGVCPGCPGTKTLGAAELQEHMLGCARLRGHNASSRHARVKVALKAVFRAAHL